jgi:hypothetical protein
MISSMYQHNFMTFHSLLVVTEMHDGVWVAEHVASCTTDQLAGAPCPVLHDDSSWRNRDQTKLFARLLEVVSDSGKSRGSSSFPASLARVSQAFTSLFDEAGSITERIKSLWAHNGQMGSRSMRKKALTDLVKLLMSLGVLLSLHYSRHLRMPSTYFTAVLLLHCRLFRCMYGLPRTSDHSAEPYSSWSMRVCDCSRVSNIIVDVRSQMTAFCSPALSAVHFGACS